MILEAFQAAIARHADTIVLMLIGGFGFMALVAFAAAGEIIRKRRPGYQPSSAGERPDPPRSGSGAQPPVDPLARIARLRAELEDLVYAAHGGNSVDNNPTMLRWAANRMSEKDGGGDFVKSIHRRADMLEGALSNARRTLEATKP